MIKKTLLRTLLAVSLIASQPVVAANAADARPDRHAAIATASETPPASEEVAQDGHPSVQAAEPGADEPSAGRSGEADKPGEADGERWIGIVTLTSGNLNVRKGPSLNDDIIGKLPNGTVIPVLEQYEEWVSIPYGSGIAYVSKPYLRLKKVSGHGGNKVIVLDPGHGGKDSGAYLKDGTREADLVWEYAAKAKEALEAAGYVVYLTRDKDSSCVDYKNNNREDLACRAEFAAKVGGDIFISIHADANPVKSFRGTVTFYNARSDYDGHQNPYPEESKRLAKLVQTQVQPVIGSRDRGIENKNYYVNRMNTVPSVLLELAVLTNSNDLKLLKNNKRKAAVAEALVKAVDLYFQTESDGEAGEGPDR